MQDDDFTDNSEHFTERHWSKISEQYRQVRISEQLAIRLAADSAFRLDIAKASLLERTAKYSEVSMTPLTV